METSEHDLYIAELHCNLCKKVFEKSDLFLTYTTMKIKTRWGILLTIQSKNLTNQK